MKMNPIFNLLRRTMFAALAATTIACGGDDPVVPQLPGGGNNGQDGTEEEKPEIKPDEGITLYGLVSDSEGNPLEGIVVSDGYSVVATDAKGVYQIVRSANAKYVFISAPSGYEIPTQANYGSYQGTYQAANSLTGSSTKPYRADFTLTKLSQSDTRFLLFGLGDPQPDNDEHIKRFRTETVPDVKKIKADYTIPTVGIALGDILGKGDAQTFTSMKRALGETGVPFFTTIGNHDKSSVDYTGDTYRDVLGPRWYSFNRGEVHFVAMDNCLFSGQDYTGGFTDEQVAWLEKDLSFVPTSKMIVLYYHIPLRDTNYRNRQKVLDLISKYQNPTLMCAHTHYFQPYHMRSHNLFERIHGGTCGYFWRSNCGGDGTPNGFMVYEIDGTKIVDTYFKASQRPDDHQIRLYHGDAVFAGPYATYKYDLGADVVVANVFAAGMDGTTWKVELSEDGGKTWSDMSPIEQNYGDRWIRGYHIGVEHHPTESGTSPCYHQYQYKLKDAAATAIEVRATDSFGHVYTQDTFTADNDFTEAENTDRTPPAQTDGLSEKAVRPCFRNRPPPDRRSVPKKIRTRSRRIFKKKQYLSQPEPDTRSRPNRNGFCTGRGQNERHYGKSHSSGRHARLLRPRLVTDVPHIQLCGLLQPATDSFRCAARAERRHGGGRGRFRLAPARQHGDRLDPPVGRAAPRRQHGPRRSAAAGRNTGDVGRHGNRPQRIQQPARPGGEIPANLDFPRP